MGRLTVTRRVDGPGLLIGEDVEVRVVQTRGGTVRLQVTTPDDVVILREELLERDPA